MCDAVGTHGILRAYIYSLKNNNSFLDRNTFPIEDMTEEKYINKCAYSSVYLFEKSLKLKDLMLINISVKVAKASDKLTIDFFDRFFDEENVPERTYYLNKYCMKNN